MNTIMTITMLMIATFVVMMPLSVYGISDDVLQEKLEFGAALEETLGHFKALEENLDDGNTTLAIAHATHPIAELYDIMKPTLVKTDPALDQELKTLLDELRNKASTSVSRNVAQNAIDTAKDTVQKARMAVIGEELSIKPEFKLMLMTTLLKTSIAEYEEAVSNREITELAEFQDGSAFVWQAEQILNTLEDNLDKDDYKEMHKAFDEINQAYNIRLDPSKIDEHTSYLISEINAILGITFSDNNTTEQDELLAYVDNINNLLKDARTEYSAGNTELALSYVTKAYLNNYEFLETPLVKAGERELMEEVEVMMREEFRAMIKNNAPTSEVSAQIDAILLKMEAVAVVVPEFGIMTILILAVAVVAVIIITSRNNRLSSLTMSLPHT